MTHHHLIGANNVHIAHNWEYADTAARTGATGLTADDNHKLAYQVDDSTLWILDDWTGPTWQLVGGGLPAGLITESDTDASGWDFVVDEDNMASNSDEKIPTQQSVKKYVDDQIDAIPGGGGIPDGAEGDIQFYKAGVFGASSGRLTWEEGADETDSFLSIDGSIVVYSAIVATNIGTPSIQSSGALNLQMIDDLSINMDSGTSGQVLQSNGPGVPPSWEDQAGGGGAVDSVNGQTGVVDIDADDIDDSSTTNKFATASELSKLAGIESGAEVNVNADWNSVSGDSQILNKPTILTAEDVRDTIGSALVAGSNITITVNDPSDTITIASSGGSSYTDEQVRDVIAAAMQDSSSIDYTNTDGSDTMTMDVKYAGSSGLYGTAGTAARSDHLHAGPYNIHWTMDEGGVPALNHKAWFRVPFAHTITSWTLMSNNAAGSCSVDVWRSDYSNFPPDSADTICGGAKPALSSSQKATSSSLGAWSTTGAADDIYTINLESADTMTLLSFILTITRTA